MGDLLFAVEHGESVDEVVLCLFAVFARLLDNLDEFLEFEGRLAVGEGEFGLLLLGGFGRRERHDVAIVHFVWRWRLVLFGGLAWTFVLICFCSFVPGCRRWVLRLRHGPGAESMARLLPRRLASSDHARGLARAPF